MEVTAPDSHSVYVEKLETYLCGHFGECILIPSKVNKTNDDGDKKIPLWPHKGVATSELWRRWMNNGSKDCSKGLVMIIRSGLIVIDVDNKELASTLELDYPELLQTATQETKKGFHYFFKRTTACDDNGIYDKSQGLMKDGNKLPIDIKTVCKNGTGGVISLYPSPDKKWLRPIYECEPLPIPETLVKFILDHSINKRTTNKKRTSKSDDNESTITSLSSMSGLLQVRSEQIQDQVQIIKALASMLTSQRADSYDSWMQVGWCLHNIGCSMVLPADTFLDDWIAFSKKSDKFEEGVCENLWEEMEFRTNGLGIGSLRMWAKEDDPEQYSSITCNWLELLLDKCFSKTQNDVAHVLYELYAKRFVCSGFTKNTWFEYKHHRWISIDGAYSIRRELSAYVFSLFEKKAAELKQKEVASLDEKEASVWKAKVKVFGELCLKLKTTGFKDGVIKECAEFFYTRDFESKLDTKKNLIGFENGVYDLEAGEFRSGQPDDYITFTTHYDYAMEDDPETEEEIMRFLQSIMPDDEMVRYILLVCAYMLHGHKSWEVFWFFVGVGRNGKGVLTTLLKVALGDYYYEPSITVVTAIQKSGSSPTPELARAKGKRVLSASEPDDGDKDTKFRVSKLKQLRGNDIIQVRALYKDCEEFTPQFGMIFQMNDMPELSKLDDAIQQSLKVVKFPYQFVQEDMLMHPDYQRPIDCSLKDKFETGIKYRQQFMRMLTKVYKEQIAGKNKKPPPDPEYVKVETKAYFDDNNPVAIWLRNKYDFTGNELDRIRTNDLFTEFKRSKDEHKSMTDRKFGKLICALGFKSKVMNSIRYYTGLSPKKFIVDDEDDELAAH